MGMKWSHSRLEITFAVLSIQMEVNSSKHKHTT